MENVLSKPDNLADSRLRRWWSDPSIRIPILIFVAARILTLLIAMMAVSIGPVRNLYATDPIFLESLQARQPANPLTPIIDPWHRWDTGWYLKIAQFGYSATDGTIVFAPLYPALMAAVGAVVGDKLLAGLLVSSAASLIFLILFYKLARLELRSERAVLQTLLAFMLFPTAFYMLAAYTEATFLALVAGTFLAARYRCWWLAALFALLASLTRTQGAALALALAWMAFIEQPRFWRDTSLTWAQRFRQAIPRLAAVAAGPLAVLAYYVYLALSHFGTVTEAYNKVWSVRVRPPWDSVIEIVRRLVTGQANFSEVANFIALLIIVALILSSIGRLAVSYHLFMLGTLILILMSYQPVTQLNSMMRYVLDFFPAFFTVGVVLARRRLWRPLWFCVGVLFQIAFLYLFACWQWVF